MSARSSSLTLLYLSFRLDTAVRLPFTAAVLPTVTGLLPRRALHCLDWVHLTGLELADPYYAVPGAVDCILGADLYPSLILEGLRIGAAQAPVA